MTDAEKLRWVADWFDKRDDLVLVQAKEKMAEIVSNLDWGQYSPSASDFPEQIVITGYIPEGWGEVQEDLRRIADELEIVTEKAWMYDELG